eukprot:5512889-Prymnesium_polylepis.1
MSRNKHRVHQEEKWGIIERIERRLEQLLSEDPKFRTAADDFDRRHHQLLRKTERAFYMVRLVSAWW